MVHAYYFLEDEERLYRWICYSLGLILDANHLDPRPGGQQESELVNSQQWLLICCCFQCKLHNPGLGEAAADLHG